MDVSPQNERNNDLPGFSEQLSPKVVDLLESEASKLGKAKSGMRMVKWIKKSKGTTSKKNLTF